MEQRGLSGLVLGVCGLASGAAAAAGSALGGPLGAGLAGCAVAAGTGLVVLGRVERRRREESAAEYDSRQAVEGERDRLLQEREELRRAVATLRPGPVASAGAVRGSSDESRQGEGPATREAPPVDSETGFLDGRYLQVALDHRIANARRQLQPLTLLLVHLGGNEVSEGYRREAVVTFADTIRETLRDSDTACRTAPDGFAVILEDTPEAGGVWAAERLRLSMLRKGGALLRFSAAVASYPSHSLAAP
ncbi:MAG: nucleotidyl cyclase domain-containing protein, partial [Acidimicrobiales bacterium]